MKKDPTIPVYLLTGFLDGGKTNFLKYTMGEDYFNDGSKTLLILCEEGEEEYEEAFLKKTHTQMVLLENEEDMTEEYFQKLSAEYKPERVLIEYNGMWDITKIIGLQFPKYWTMYQIISLFDAQSFKLYLNNIKTGVMNILTSTDMVIFNRCDKDSDLVLFQRTVRSVNQRCELVFEDKTGNEMECPEPDLPYSVDAKEIEISDEDFTTFFLDLSEHPDRYVGKQISALIQIMQEKNFPKNMFVGGRRAMTCCEADIRFLPFIYIFDKAKSIKNKEWACVKATMQWEFHEGYQQEGPVFYVEDLKLATPPADELVYF